MSPTLIQIINNHYKAITYSPQDWSCWPINRIFIFVGASSGSNSADPNSKIEFSTPSIINKEHIYTHVGMSFYTMDKHIRKIILFKNNLLEFANCGNDYQLWKVPVELVSAFLIKKSSNHKFVSDLRAISFEHSNYCDNCGSKTSNGALCWACEHGI